MHNIVSWQNLDKSAAKSYAWAGGPMDRGTKGPFTRPELDAP